MPTQHSYCRETWGHDKQGGFRTAPAPRGQVGSKAMGHYNMSSLTLQQSDVTHSLCLHKTDVMIASMHQVVLVERGVFRLQRISSSQFMNGYDSTRNLQAIVR